MVHRKSKLETGGHLAYQESASRIRAAGFGDGSSD